MLVSFFINTYVAKRGLFSIFNRKRRFRYRIYDIKRMQRIHQQILLLFTLLKTKRCHS